MKNLAQKLHARLGAKIFQDALHDYAQGNLLRRTPWHIAATLVSIVVILTPFLTILSGLFVLTVDFPNIITLLVGAILIGVGWSLVPRRFRSSEKGLSRQELPETYALLDRIAEHMGTKAPDTILLDETFNAFLHRPIIALHPSTRLGVGLALWEACTVEERVALLAHELGHSVNGDAARNGLVGVALTILEGWIETLSPSRVMAGEEGAGGFLAEILGSLLGSIAEGVSVLLGRLVYLDQQRAEYLADALAAQVAGTDAAISLLERVSLADLLMPKYLGLSSSYKEEGADLFAHLAEPAQTKDSPEATKLLQRMQDEDLTVDRTHPPTRFRIGFAEAIGPLPATIALLPGEMDRIDAELRPYAEEVAEHLYAKLDYQ